MRISGASWRELRREIGKFRPGLVWLFLWVAFVPVAYGELENGLDEPIEKALLTVESLTTQPPLQRAISPVNMAWYRWEPYQYVNQSGDVVGLDRALIEAIFAASGVDVEYDATQRSTWQENLRDVSLGVQDAAAGAFANSERLQRYFLSNPYRHEWNRFFTHNELKPVLASPDLESLLAEIERHQFRLGVVRGYRYTSDVLNRYIDKHMLAKTGLVIASDQDAINFSRLAARELELVVSDRLVGAQLLMQKSLGGKLVELPLELPSKPLHLLVHRGATVQEHAWGLALIEAFNLGIEHLQTSGEFDAIIGQYLFPVLLNMTVKRDWFYWIDLAGALFFAIAGVMVAREHRLDLFGTLVMTALLVTGGGVLRDVFVGRTPMILQSNDYVMIILFVWVCGFLCCYFYDRRLSENDATSNYRGCLTSRIINVRAAIESIGMGAYIIIGVGVAVEMRLQPLSIWGPLLGCVSSCGGGLLASMLRQQSITAIRGLLAPECTLLWGFLFAVFMGWQSARLDPNEVYFGVLITLAGTSVTLMTIRIFKWRSPRLGKARSVASQWIKEQQ